MHVPERYLGAFDPEQLVRRLVIAYEPVWAIGVGKPTPDSDYLEMISQIVGEYKRKAGCAAVPTVYGGGLRLENVSWISGVPGIDGGLVALTRFTGDIGFYPEEFTAIVKNSAWAEGKTDA